MTDVKPLVDVAYLARRFAVPGVAIAPGKGGLTCVSISNPHTEAQLYLHGAHISHFQPRDQPPVLWMSGSSNFAADKPIRGGIPLCWPWFGPHPTRPELPAHGFARLREWTLASVSQTTDQRTRIELTLASDPATLALWPYPFQLIYALTIGAKLEIELTVRNTSQQPFTCDEALHTYLAVADVRQVSVHGLAGCTYIDKTDSMQRKIQAGAVTIAAETDRVYLNTVAASRLDDPGLARSITVAKGGSKATVVWNPWIAKAAAMKDFGDDEWPGMICIETANTADHAMTVGPGATHRLTATIGVGPLKA